ncbi:MAG TPA: hypothetical protein VF322_12670 [Gammaproteobacteria bacterium]
MTVVRKQILLGPAHNERLQRLRAVTGMSESEIVRRSLEAYDPEGAAGLEDNAEVRELLESLMAQNARTAEALQQAEAEIEATERYLAALRAERGGAAAKPRAARKARRAAGRR